MRGSPKALAACVIALTSFSTHILSAWAADVIWLSPVINNECEYSCSQGNDPAYPEYHMQSLKTYGGQLCRLQETGRIGTVFGKRGEQRGCYVANLRQDEPSPNDKCPKKAPRTPYEFGCQMKDKYQQPVWVPYVRSKALCNDPPTTWAICRVRPAMSSPRRKYGMGFYQPSPDRCIFNPTAAKSPPEICSVQVAESTESFDILCLNPKS